MDQLVKMVSERADIDEARARTAVETVLGFLKDRLPAPIAGQIDGAVSGQGGRSESGAGSLGGMFGGGDR